VHPEIKHLLGLLDEAYKRAAWHGQTYADRFAELLHTKRRGVPRPGGIIFGKLPFTLRIGNIRSGGACLGKSAARFRYQGATGFSGPSNAANRRGGPM